MNKKIPILTVITLFLCHVVSAAPQLYNTCGVSNHAISGNTLDPAAFHFTCCQDAVCKTGNAIRKTMHLVDMQHNGAYGQADMTAFNHNGVDTATIVLRTENLPKNQMFTAWMIEENNTRSKLGAFKTNAMGRGYLLYKQTLSWDFNQYHTMVVETAQPNVTMYLWNNNMNFTTAKMPFNHTSY